MSVWAPVLDIPDEEFWAVREQNNRDLLAYLHECTRRRWASREIRPARRSWRPARSCNRNR